MATLLGAGFVQAPQDGSPLRPGTFRTFERPGAFYLRVCAGKAKNERKAEAARRLWASRTAEERADVGRKIRESLKGRRPSAEAPEKRRVTVRRRWAVASKAERTARTAAAVEAARAQLAGTERRREINRKAAAVAASAPAWERRRRAQKGARTRKARGTDRAGALAMQKATRERWAKLSPAERSEISRQRALKRWRRARGEE